jgi:hypothetical protein
VEQEKRQVCIIHKDVGSFRVVLEVLGVKTLQSRFELHYSLDCVDSKDTTSVTTVVGYPELLAKAIVIGHGLMLLLSIARWHNFLNSQLLVYDGYRQAPPNLMKLLPEGTDLDPDIWLTHHKSIPAFPRRNASTSLNRRSFGSKRYF